jgi:DNA-binding LytR/AlgR family response regulator
MFRTNKSFAINLDFVQDITPQYVTVNDVEVPIAKSYAEDLKKYFRLF